MTDLIKTFEGHTSYVQCLSVLGGRHDGTFLSGSDDRTTKQWDIRSGACLKTFEGHSYLVGCISVLDGHNDGTFLSGAADGTIKHWSTSLSRQREETNKRKSVLMSELEEFAYLPPEGDFPGGPRFKEAEKDFYKLQI